MRTLRCLTLLLTLPAPLAAQPRPPAAAPASTLTLDELLRRFRALPGLSCRFREEKRMALLAAPLVSRGTLEYAAPGRMVRRTQSPAPSVALIEGARLRFLDEGGEQSLDLDAMPVVRQFLESFMALVAGDRAALERHYAPVFHAEAPTRWSLTLRPRSPALARVFREISLAGDGVTLSTLTVREASGDESVTTFSEVDVARRYSPAEAARVFRLAP
ncbi:MAG: outer membrane lipoprotein carrier protein LolA [Polyangiales bacterium]